MQQLLIHRPWATKLIITTLPYSIHLYPSCENKTPINACIPSACPLPIVLNLCWFMDLFENLLWTSPEKNKHGFEKNFKGFLTHKTHSSDLTPVLTIPEAKIDGTSKEGGSQKSDRLSLILPYLFSICIKAYRGFENKSQPCAVLTCPPGSGSRLIIANRHRT